MTEPVYSSVDEFDGTTRSLLEDHLSENETVLLGIDCTGTNGGLYGIGERLLGNCF